MRHTLNAFVILADFTKAAAFNGILFVNAKYPTSHKKRLILTLTNSKF